VGATIVEVPAMAGDRSHAAADGPAALTATLASVGCRPAVSGVAIPAAAAGDVQAASLEVASRVAVRVRQIVARGDQPIVLAGSCDVAPGVLAGLRDPDVGVVWIDAHADFNTPASSTTGFWPGMTLAVVVGDCGENVWSALRWHPVAAERVMLVGVRSLSPAAEARRLDASATRVVRWHNGSPLDRIDWALDGLSKQTRRAYVHLDLDALDPAVGQGVVDPPVPGGLTATQLEQLVADVHDRFTVAAATIATYTPANDDGSTLPIAITAIRSLVARES
jgi:arginase